ncbi:MAG: LCP family protein [Candidatus Peribacteraceae bacterium]
MAGAVGLTLVSPFLFLLRKRRERQQLAETQERRTGILKRMLLVLLAIFLSLAVLAGVAKALVALNVVNIRTFLNIAGADLPRDENGFTNFLLLGKGDDDHDGFDLTDTMMVASVDPKTKSVVMLSIPRDLYVKSAVMGEGRINLLYRDYKASLIRRQDMEKAEAAQLALKELLNEVGGKLHVQLHHAVMVNFSGFVDVVDALGGIDVEVPYDIVDREYPGPDWTYQTFEIHAGPTHLDGETALKYARSRHTTSDFGRSARQQQIIQALGERAKTVGIVKSPRKILALLRILSANVETTMNGQELLGAAKMGERLERSRVISMQLNDRNGLYTGLAEAGGFLYTPPREDFGGAAVLLPVVTPPDSPLENSGWRQIRTFFSLLLNTRTLYLQNPRISVLNAGAKTGMAARIATELIRYGFTVDRVENAELPPSPDSKARRGILPTSAVSPAVRGAEESSGSEGEETAAAAFFSDLLGFPLAPLPVDLPLEQQGQVTILLGEDYAFRPFHEVLKESASSSSLATP